MEGVDPRRLAERVAERLGVGRLEPRVCTLDGVERRVGVLIAVEGIDGAGTTTVAKLLVEALRHLGLPAVYTKEPTGSPVGRLIRSLLSGARHPQPELLAHLFAADRLHHLYVEEVAPGARGVAGALAEGYLVVTDRYKYSSAAYQSRLVDPRSAYEPRDVLELNSLTPPAHILVYLDAEPSVAYARIRSRKRLEIYENPETLARVRRAYHHLLDLLSRQPEKPDAGRWVEKLEAHTGLPIHCLYPDERYPEEIMLDANRGVGAVATDTIISVARALVRKRLVRLRRG